MAQVKRLWIIEDMEDLYPVYRDLFNPDEYALTFFNNFENFANSYNKQSNVDLIIADMILPDGHFINLLNETDMTLNTPYLVISSSDALDNIRHAFEAGAIDYILKPFNYNEIIGKVEKHLQKIDEKNFETSKSLEALNLNFSQFTNKEIKIIESFNIRDDKTLHRNEIVKIIWKNIAIHPNTLDVHIYNLRKKLKASGFNIKAIGNGLFRFTYLDGREIPVKEKALDEA
jgi:DNA-binding response OmpR family regulator